MYSTFMGNNLHKCIVLSWRISQKKKLFFMLQFSNRILFLKKLTFLKIVLKNCFRKCFQRGTTLPFFFFFFLEFCSWKNLCLQKNSCSRKCFHTLQFFPSSSSLIGKRTKRTIYVHLTRYVLMFQQKLLGIKIKLIKVWDTQN